MTTLIDVSRCPLRCHDRGTCFTWPPEPEFAPICACSELWEGKTCEHRQHNPFNVRRERVANTQWRAMYGVACTSNETAATCNECGEHRCGAEGECEWKAVHEKAGAKAVLNDCTLRVDKVVPYRPRMYSSLYGKPRGRGRGRDASPGAKGRGAPAKGLAAEGDLGPRAVAACHPDEIGACRGRCPHGTSARRGAATRGGGRRSPEGGCVSLGVARRRCARGRREPAGQLVEAASLVPQLTPLTS